MPAWMFFKNMLHHIRAVDTLGFHGAILFFGHSGPHHTDAPKSIDILQSHVDVQLFSIIGTDAPESRFPDNKGIGGHAGRGETSLLWATDADCVDLSRMPALDAPGPHFAMGDEVETSDRRTSE